MTGAHQDEDLARRSPRSHPSGPRGQHDPDDDEEAEADSERLDIPILAPALGIPSEPGQERRGARRCPGRREGRAGGWTRDSTRGRLAGPRPMCMGRDGTECLLWSTPRPGPGPPAERRHDRAAWRSVGLINGHGPPRLDGGRVTAAFGAEPPRARAGAPLARGACAPPSLGVPPRVRTPREGGHARWLQESGCPYLDVSSAQGVRLGGPSARVGGRDVHRTGRAARAHL